MLYVALGAHAGIGQHHHPGLVPAGSLQDGIEIGVETAGNHQHGSPELVERHEHLLGRLGLSHDAHFVLNRQHFGDSRPKNGLIVAKMSFSIASAPLAYEWRTKS